MHKTERTTKKPFISSFIVNNNNVNIDNNIASSNIKSILYNKEVN